MQAPEGGPGCALRRPPPPAQEFPIGHREPPRAARGVGSPWGAGRGGAVPAPRARVGAPTCPALSGWGRGYLPSPPGPPFTPGRTPGAGQVGGTLGARRGRALRDIGAGRSAPGDTDGCPSDKGPGIRFSLSRELGGRGGACVQGQGAGHRRGGRPRLGGDQARTPRPPGRERHLGRCWGPGGLRGPGPRAPRGREGAPSGGEPGSCSYREMCRQKGAPRGSGRNGESTAAPAWRGLNHPAAPGPTSSGTLAGHCPWHHQRCGRLAAMATRSLARR